MSKERNASKEPKKKATMSLKEKRAAKKAKKEGRPAFSVMEKK